MLRQGRGWLRGKGLRRTLYVYVMSRDGQVGKLVKSDLKADGYMEFSHTGK